MGLEYDSTPATVSRQRRRRWQQRLHTLHRPAVPGTGGHNRGGAVAGRGVAQRNPRRARPVVPYCRLLPPPPALPPSLSLSTDDATAGGAVRH